MIAPPGPGRVPVLQMIDSLERGGAERMAVAIANGLSRDRWSCHLCTTRREGPLARELSADTGRLRLGRRVAFSPRAVARLRRYVVEQRIGIVHAHGSALLLASLLAGGAKGPRLVWHDHNGRPRRGWLYRRAIRRVDALLTVRREFRAWAERRPGADPGRIHFLPNFLPTAGREQGAVPVLPGERGQRVICVANLRPIKDQIALVAAVGFLKARFPRIRLLLVGAEADRAYAADLRRAAAARGLSDRVHLLGGRDDVAAILSQCAVGVSASRREGFPVTLLEYGRAGLAVAATDTGSCAEILEYGRAGLLTPPGDPAALAAALGRLLACSEDRARLALRLRHRVDTCYGQERILARLEGVYERVLADPQGRGPAGDPASPRSEVCRAS